MEICYYREAVECTGNTSCVYDVDPESGIAFFSVGFSHRGNNIDDYQYVRVVAGNVNLDNFLNQTFQLKEDIDYSSSYGSYINNFDDPFQTNQVQIGELKILSFNKQKRTVSGTFWFDSKNNEGQILHVTDGRFDLYY